MSRSSPDNDCNNGENPSTTVPEIKKRRIQRACDGCRRKKGDGFQMPGNQCSNCIAYSFRCTYAEVAKKRVPPKGSTTSLTVLSFLARYVESLENRLEKMEKLLQTVCPDTDFTQELGGSRMDAEVRHTGNTESLHIMNTPSTSTNSGPSTGEDLAPIDDDYIVTVYLSEGLRNMDMNPSQPRFFGKSSGITLLQQAIDVRKEYAVDDDTRTEDFFRTDTCGERFPSEYVARHIRETEYKFPERDLGVSLIDLYFLIFRSFDLDLPVECDDEYWEHPDPEQAFKQPSDKPSTMSFFMSFLKLNRVLAFALKTLYSINQSKILLGFVGQRWEQYVVAELDSSLNKWVDAVPPHLRWDPTRDINTQLFAQSSVLYTSYYLVQILIHRPFIPSPRKPSPLPFPSLAICTNAARSCTHVLDVYNRGSPYAAASFMQMPAYTVGVVLLLNIWGGKRSGLSINPLKEMADVDVCLSVLKRCEKRWHTSGRLWDVLYELASVGELPLPHPSFTAETKFEGCSDSPSSSANSVSTSEEGPRTIAGSRYIQQDSRSRTQYQQFQHVSSPFTLPLYSSDLGQLPLHRQINFPINTSTASSTASTPPQMDPQNVRYPPSSTGTHRSLDGPSPAPAPSHTHDFTHPRYSMHDLFYDQSTSPSGSTFASQHSSPHTQFAGTTSTTYGAGGGAGGQAWTGGYAATNDSRALMDTASASVHMDVHVHEHWHDMVDPATIAMWSAAPTGFEYVSISLAFLDDWIQADFVRLLD
ncbi:hypothetical protein BS17DRAFT_705117 [Gyrodon lividus]|nr:hypothetical protein BS17DRAFT_705117 [Gyrodon lividus]